MLSVQIVSGVPPVWMQRTNSRMTPACPTRFVGALDRRHLDIAPLREESPCFGHDLGLEAGCAIPAHAALRPDDLPTAFPRRVQAFGAPTAPIGEGHVPGQLEEGHRRGVAVIPGARRIPLPAVDGDGVGAGNQPGGVEGVNGHVQQQHMRHVVPETAKVRADVEVAVDGRHPPDDPRRQEGAQPADIGVVAAVLDDGVGLAGGLGGGDHAPGVGHRVGQRLLAQDVTAVLQRGQRDLRMCFRHRAVEDQIRAELSEDLAQVGADGRLGPPILGSTVASRLFIDIHKADHAQVRNIANSIQPGAADAAAAGQDNGELSVHVRLLSLFVMQYCILYLSHDEIAADIPGICEIPGMSYLHFRPATGIATRNGHAAACPFRNEKTREQRTTHLYLMAACAAASRAIGTR